MAAFFKLAIRWMDRISVFAGIGLIAALLCIAEGGAIWIAIKVTNNPSGTFPTLLLATCIVIFLVALYILVGLGLANKRGMEYFSVVLERIASGNLTDGTKRRATAASSASEAGRMWKTMMQMSANLVEIVSQVRASAERIGSGSHEIAAGYDNLSQRTEEQASTLEETAASMEELSATVKQNAEACRQANTSADETGKRAEEAGNSMQLVSTTMTRIEDGSKKMSEIIGLIEGIAFQTNILALNAAVEAARAGEHGRGFSVVAAEVRSLAQKSAQAAEEIKGLITASTKDVADGGALVEQAHEAVDRAVASVREVVQLIESVATASEEQSAGVQEIGKAITQLEGVTQQNAALVEEGAATATAFQQEAERLIEVVGAFKLDRMEEREKVEALIRRGIEHVHAVGAERALKDFHNPHGGFVEDDRYIYAFNMQGVLLASPFRPELLGVDQSEHGDHDGKKYVQEILRIAKTMGKGWCDYRSTNPVTRRPEPKSAYVERAGDVILGCGIYSDTSGEQAHAPSVTSAPKSSPAPAGRNLPYVISAAGMR